MAADSCVEIRLNLVFFCVSFSSPLRSLLVRFVAHKVFKRRMHSFCHHNLFTPLLTDSCSRIFFFFFAITECSDEFMIH